MRTLLRFKPSQTLCAMPSRSVSPPFRPYLGTYLSPSQDAPYKLYSKPSPVLKERHDGTPPIQRHKQGQAGRAPGAVGRATSRGADAPAETPPRPPWLVSPSSTSTTTTTPRSVCTPGSTPSEKTLAERGREWG